MSYYRTIVHNRSVKIRIDHHGELMAIWHDGLYKPHSTDTTHGGKPLFDGVRKMGYMLERAAEKHASIVERLKMRGNYDQASVEEHVVNDLRDAALELYQTVTRAIDDQYHEYSHDMMHKCAAYHTVPAFL